VTGGRAVSALEEGVWGRDLLKVSPPLARPQNTYPSTTSETKPRPIAAIGITGTGSQSLTATHYCLPVINAGYFCLGLLEIGGIAELW